MTLAVRKGSIEPKLVKVDRNGSKHYVVEACPKCGGYGYGPWYVDGGRCWNCDATGIKPHTYIERTPEYQKKLDDRRLAKAKAAAPESNKRWLKANGFNEEGSTFAYFGKTYDIKNELREKGAKYCAELGWHSEMQIGDYPGAFYNYQQICLINEAEQIHGFSQEKIAETFDKANREYVDELYENKDSEYFGVIGRRYELKLKQLAAPCFDSLYGTTYINKFEDENGNIFIWKTGKQVTETGNTVILKGTVKEHQEYKNTKQTVLSRCKEIQ